MLRGCSPRSALAASSGTGAGAEDRRNWRRELRLERNSAAPRDTSMVNPRTLRNHGFVGDLHVYPDTVNLCKYIYIHTHTLTLYIYI